MLPKVLPRAFYARRCWTNFQCAAERRMVTLCHQLAYLSASSYVVAVGQHGLWETAVILKRDRRSPDQAQKYHGFTKCNSAPWMPYNQVMTRCAATRTGSCIRSRQPIRPCNSNILASDNVVNSTARWDQQPLAGCDRAKHHVRDFPNSSHKRRDWEVKAVPLAPVYTNANASRSTRTRPGKCH